MNVIQKLAHRSNYGTLRDLSSIKYIVIHYTGNDGDKTYSNAAYFQKPLNPKSSAHLFVDDNYIYQSVPYNHVAYSVGAKSADTSQGGGKFFGKCTNSNSISIELCDTDKNGAIYPTQKTIDNAIAITKELMVKFSINADHVIRHFDVTGKLCPAYWVKDKYWMSEFKSKLTQVTEGWVHDNNGWWYRYKDGSYPASCWKTIKGKDYYFKADGYMASDEYIKSANYNTNKALYYVDKDGAWDGATYRWMKDDTGWWIAKVGGSWYAENCWCTIDGKKYYFNDKGYMVTGTKTINGRIYSFDKNGVKIG